MKALWNLSMEIITALATASIDLISVANIGGAPEQYNVGGNNQ